MLNNKKFNIIISLVIAVGLWAYVIGETNPKDTKVYRDIPLVFLNEQILEDSNLAILEKSSESLTVTIYGTRTALSEVEERDIVATVDLADAAKGTNELKVNIRVPDTVEIDDKSINKVTVVVENKVTKKVGVQVDYTGSFANDTEAITVEMGKKEVTVSGAESQVKKVAYAQASIDAAKVSGKIKDMKSHLSPVNKRGEVIANIRLSTESIKIKTVLAKIKTVPLNVPITDNSNDGIKRDVSVPETITVKGLGEDVDQIEEIKAEGIDVTNIVENTTLNIQPVLPKGVQLSDQTEALKAKVTVESTGSKTFTFDGAEIDLLGLADDLSVTVKTDKVEITVTGSKKIISALTKADFTLSADLSNLTAGNNQVSLKVDCGKEYTKMEINPVKIKVMIE